VPDSDVPTVHRERGFRFYFWSNERNEPPHIHVESGDGYAKFWLSPVSLVESVGYDASELSELLRIVRREQDRFQVVWRARFGR
jgi:hypothetical protein